MGHMVSVQKALIHLIDNKVLCYQAGAQVSKDHFVSQHSLGKKMSEEQGQQQYQDKDENLALTF